MRFSVLTSLAFVGATFAAPSVAIQKRQEISNVAFVLEGYKTILANANKLIEKTTKLKEGDDIPAALKEMSTLSGGTISVTEKMVTDINALSGKMTTAAAIQVAKPSAEVALATVKIIDNLVAKKKLFANASVHKIVGEDLNKLYTTTDSYVKAAKAKIPDQFVAQAGKYLQQLLDTLKKGITEFDKL